jgi:PST family polysaccharide transporter
VKPEDWLKPLTTHDGMRDMGTRALTLVGASQVVKLTVNVCATLVLVRLLSPSAFGLAAMAAVLVNFMLLFKDLGLGTATVQSSTLSQQQLSTIFWLGQLGGLVFAVLGLALAPLMAWVFSEPQLIHALMLLSAGFLLGTSASQHTALLTRHLRFGALGAVEIASVACGLGLAVLLAWLGYGWWSLVWQRVFQMVCFTVGVWITCSWRPSFDFRLSEVRTHVSLGLHVSGASLAGYASRNADNLLIGWYWGATALGFYSKAYDLLMAPLTQVAGPLGQALQPILGRLRDDPDRYRMVITHVLSASLLILLPVGTLMAWRSSDVTVLLLGEPWLPAAPIVGWFGLLVCFHLCGSILTWSLVTRQRGMDLSRTAVVNAFVNLVGFAVSLPYGVVAVAATYTLLGALVRTPYFLYVCSGDEFLPRASVLKALALPLVSFVSISLLYTALAATPTVIRLPGWQSLLFQLAMGYLLLTALVFPSSLGRFVLRRGQPPKS